MEINRATNNDLNAIMEIIENAREYFQKYGIAQWQNGKPDEDEIARSIERKETFIFYDEGELIGFATVTFVYENGAGIYAVIHRLAIGKGFKNKGFATEFMEYVDELCKRNGIGCIRLDTHPDNLAMRRALKKSGFMHTGNATVDGDSSFMAYEKELKVLKN